MKKSILIRLIFLGVVAVSVLSAVILTLVLQNPERFTDEEHKSRITARIEKTYMTNGGEYDSFSVYPVYTQKDKPKYYLIEFEPSGYLYVRINDKTESRYLYFWGTYSMYMRSDITVSSWTEYGKFEAERFVGYDENGNEIFEITEEIREVATHCESPFAFAGIHNEKRYLLYMDDTCGYIPAVKRNGTFFNVISGSEAVLKNGKFDKEQAYERVNFVCRL